MKLLLLIACALLVAACHAPTAPRHDGCVPIALNQADTLWVLPGTAHSAPECRN